MQLEYEEWASLALSYYHHDCAFDPEDCNGPCHDILKSSKLVALIHGDVWLDRIKDGLQGKMDLVFQYGKF